MTFIDQLKEWPLAHLAMMLLFLIVAMATTFEFIKYLINLKKKTDDDQEQNKSK